MKNKKSFIPYFIVLLAVITVIIFVPVFPDGESMQSKVIKDVMKSRSPKAPAVVVPPATVVPTTPATNNAFDGTYGACCASINGTYYECDAGFKCRGASGSVVGSNPPRFASFGVCDKATASETDPVPTPRLPYCGL